ncbi:triose-phosphate isomerase [Mycoplasmopsis agassizii]|uniref:triose-phosphate isomerase n=1 Tax=Mycoplasmopsis agassizii TaxID=33922 RepID=UPI003527EA96
MKKLYIIGNWKMNKTASEVEGFAAEFIELYKSHKHNISENTTFGIAAPAVSLSKLHMPSLRSMHFKVVAQDSSAHEKGAYTGEISANILKSYDVDMVVLGHSERRQYHHETSEEVNLKAKLAIASGLTPIICVGETLDEYQAGISKEVVEKQIKQSLRDLDLSKIIIAYEPVWAIGTGKTATAEEAQNMASFIKRITSKDVVVQYGGSVNPKNVAELMSQEDIDGALVGGASLVAGDFIKLLTLNK